MYEKKGIYMRGGGHIWEGGRTLRRRIRRICLCRRYRKGTSGGQMLMLMLVYGSTFLTIQTKCNCAGGMVTVIQAESNSAVWYGYTNRE